MRQIPRNSRVSAGSILWSAAVALLGCHAPDNLAAPLDGAKAAVGSSGFKAPSTLGAAAISQTQIDLSWQDNSPNESGFEVHRSSTGPSGSFTLVATTGSNVRTYRNTSLTPLTQYCYRVRAVRWGAGSTSYTAYSNTACAATGTVGSVTVVPESAAVVVGGYFGFRAEVKDNFGSPVAVPVSWASSDPEVATVSTTGQATGIARGSTTITAATGGTSGSARFVVITPLLITTATSGIDLDPSGYHLSVDGSASSETIGLNATTSFELGPGNHLIGLIDVAPNCAVHGENPRHVMISPDADTEIGFEIVCEAAEKIAYVAFAMCYEGGICDQTSWRYDVLSLAHLDGSEPVFLALGYEPTWSPDGSKVAFATNNGEIAVVNIADGSVAQLTQHPAYDRSPDWSPDGSRIAFASNRDGPTELYLMSVDGSGVMRVTNSVGFVGEPDWSPDGTRIAFDCMIEDGNRDICMTNLNGSGLTRLTTDPGDDSGPAWSPDGTRIAFGTSRYSQEGWELAVLTLSGMAISHLAAGVPGEQPAWSSDGSRIAFTSFVGWCDLPGLFSCPYVQVITADGTGVPAGFGPATAPVWRPRNPGTSLLGSAGRLTRSSRP